MARFDQQAPASKSDGPRTNQEIDNRTVRLIGADGENFGVVDRETALRKADEAGLDLVEISPNADPPVCKILDIGKYKYEEQKRKNE
ncbi:MAG: translation initiation factor IF-3, partial [Rhodospirillaceae bacterium]|nr:translation initiation factor IF-3 [Rhodospirillaceae bacterium]